MSSPSPLAQRALAQLPSAEAACLQRCLGQPMEGPRVQDYVATLQARASREEFLDLETAERTAAACNQAHDLAESVGTDEARTLARAAAAYFVLEDDAEADDSVIGFDDDLRVAEAVVAVLREEAGS